MEPHGLSRPSSAHCRFPRPRASDRPGLPWFASAVVSKSTARIGWVFCRLLPMSRASYSPLHLLPGGGAPFGPSAWRSRPCDLWLFLPFRASVPIEPADCRDLLRPLLTSAPRSDTSRRPQSPFTGAQDRPPEVSPASFDARLPDLPPTTLDRYGLRDLSPTRPVAAASYPVLVHQAAPSLSLPSDGTSRCRPCESLALRLHQAGQRTCTSKLPDMLGTPKKEPPLAGRFTFLIFNRSRRLVYFGAAAVVFSFAFSALSFAFCAATWRSAMYFSESSRLLNFVGPIGSV